ncbi:hypothetical protein BC351_15420 [Paenibacillus ferrarius]|uniref:Uncharacterized protein n=1 Tax=Paenibacillus ferrarius TaxID=1469647 RepID=A0A1V4HRJ8_9BACL|nr:hypothetical protein BC351_15420 [Paenibacillus ferrarius]
MDKRSLSSSRDIRSRKRALLSNEGNGNGIKNYIKLTIHDLFSKFIELKRSEGFPNLERRTYFMIRSISRTFLKLRDILNSWRI